MVAHDYIITRLTINESSPQHQYVAQVPCPSWLPNSDAKESDLELAASSRQEPRGSTIDKRL